MAAVLLNSRFTFSPRFSEDDFDQSPFALPYIIVPPAVAPTPAKHDVFPELCVQQPQPFSLCMAFDDVISQTMVILPLPSIFKNSTNRLNTGYHPQAIPCRDLKTCKTNIPECGTFHSYFYNSAWSCCGCICAVLF